MNSTASYTSAKQWPLKIYRDSDLLYSIRATGTILPRHASILPTNHCDLSCTWCSCSERDKSQEMPTDELLALVDTLADLGTIAVSITGGGEPCLHPGLNELIWALSSRGIRAGLVTNGISASNLTRASIDSLTWCRVSFSDTRKWDDHRLQGSLRHLRDSSNLDLAFSYVLTDRFNASALTPMAAWAHANNCTHIRVVTDILNPSRDSIRDAKQVLGEDPLVIWQDRTEYEPGRERCWISLLKPTIGPDGQVYPCCGVQYAIDDSKDFPEQMRMGHWRDLPRIISRQRVFDGSICKRCFYSEYNQALGGLKAELKHVEFV